MYQSLEIRTSFLALSSCIYFFAWISHLNSIRKTLNLRCEYDYYGKNAVSLINIVHNDSWRRRNFISLAYTGIVIFSTQSHKYIHTYIHMSNVPFNLELIGISSEVMKFLSYQTVSNKIIYTWRV